MRFSCKSCQATFQTATGAPAAAGFRCPSCNGEMAAAAEVVELWQDRIPTRRYDLDDLRARLDAEREEFARSRGARLSADQIWFAAVQGRQVGPLSAAGIAGLRARGQLSAASLVWREGWPSWVAAEAVPELRAILGLPEETLGRPFPVQPAAPAPPPFDSTYAAARESEPFAEPFPEAKAPAEKTDPDARLPELLARSLADERPAAPAAAPRDPPRAAPVPLAPAEEPTPSASPAAGESTPVEEETSLVEEETSLVEEETSLVEEEATLIAEVATLVVPAPPAPTASSSAAPSLPPLPPAEPPALPRADDSELERVASAVFAQARSSAPGAAAQETASAEAPPPHESEAPAAAAAQPAEAAAPAAPAPKPASAPSAPPALDAAPPAAQGTPPGPSEPPLAMIDLSAPAPTDELPAPRRSRPPSQQQWFSAPDERPEADPRSRFVLVGALGLALVVLWLLMRSR